MEDMSDSNPVREWLAVESVVHLLDPLKCGVVGQDQIERCPGFSDVGALIVRRRVTPDQSCQSAVTSSTSFWSLCRFLMSHGWIVS